MTSLCKDMGMLVVGEGVEVPVERDTQYRVIEELPKAAAPEAAMKVAARNAERRSLSVLGRSSPLAEKG